MRLTKELRDRTKAFASRVVRLHVKLPQKRKEVEVLGLQLLRSGTSVAANAREASRARSNAEFFSKVGTMLQETDESALWLELLIEDCKLDTPDIQPLHDESQELIAIFATMISRRQP